MIPALTALIAVLAWLALPAGASASTAQVSIIQDDDAVLADPVGVLAKMRDLGAQQVRVAIRWDMIAPAADSFRAPSGFRAANPAAYPSAGWAPYDQIVRDALADGIEVNFNVVGGAPLWATGPGMPRGSGYPYHQWEPSAAAFRAFMEAVGRRYSGSYDPRTRRTSPGNPDDLPRVSFWSIWNEPDYGPSLAPQALPGHPNVEDSPRLYRQLVDAAWSGLRATGHGRDQFIFGELAPRSIQFTFGNFNGMLPLVFLRALYCLDAGYHPLRGQAAALRGCPTTAAASGRFRSQHPALFQATGFSDHPYMRWYPPNDERNSPWVPHFSSLVTQFSSLGTIRNLERALDRVVRVYGSSRRFPIWNTEFGYLTNPPKRIWRKNHYPYVSLNTAAYYDNWAEYLSYKDPRIASFEQYLLRDPVAPAAANNFGGFASGLLTFGGRPKPGYGAWRMPLYLPRTVAASSSQPLEVWGAVKPVHFAMMDQPSTIEQVLLLFRPRDSQTYSIIDTIPISSPHGYYDVREAFPSSGTLVAEWAYPEDSLLASSGQTVFSRSVKVTVK
jgi:hypothetical protein